MTTWFHGSASQRPREGKQKAEYLVHQCPPRAWQICCRVASRMGESPGSHKPSFCTCTCELNMALWTSQRTFQKVNHLILPKILTTGTHECLLHIASFVESAMVFKRCQIAKAPLDIFFHGRSCLTFHGNTTALSSRKGQFL